jgi:prepilin peptidase CpaA
LTIFDLALVSISSLSAFFDMTVRRIPNWLIAIGVASGLSISAFQGGHDFVQSVLGLVIGIAVLILPFAMGWIGAGDVKFFGVTGALLGVLLLPRIFFYSAVVAGLIAVASLLFGKIRFFSFKQIWLDVKIALISVGNVLPAPVRNRVLQRDESIPWGVAFAAGALIAYYVDPEGRWAGF